MSDNSGSHQGEQWKEPQSQDLVCALREGCQALELPRKRPGRPATVGWSHLCLGVVLAVLQGWQAQLDLWRWIAFESFGPFSSVQVCDQAISNRLERAASPMRQLFEAVSRWLQTRIEPGVDRHLAPFAKAVLALDESSLDQVGRWLPWLRGLPAGADELLAGRISALFDVRLQQWVHIEILKKGKTNAQESVRLMLSGLCKATLLLFDRGYFCFELLDELRERGLWWITRYSHKASFQVRHICYQGDGVFDAIIRLGVYRSGQAKYPVRLVRFWMGGKQYSYLTNVLDPHLLPLADIARLYARRWDIELAFRLLKDHLRLCEIWSAKWEVICAQLWATLLLAQVFHALQVQIAAQAEVEVFEVSVDLLVRFVPQWMQRGVSPVEQAVRFGRQMGLIRQSTRHQVQVPWVDPTWVVPPPPQALQPRDKVRYRSKTGRSKNPPT